VRPGLFGGAPIGFVLANRDRAQRRVRDAACFGRLRGGGLGRGASGVLGGRLRSSARLGPGGACSSARTRASTAARARASVSARRSASAAARCIAAAWASASSVARRCISPSAMAAS
jgi:hypothetical protein